MLSCRCNDYWIDCCSSSSIWSIHDDSLSISPYELFVFSRDLFLVFGCWKTTSLREFHFDSSHSSSRISFQRSIIELWIRFNLSISRWWSSRAISRDIQLCENGSNMSIENSLEYDDKLARIRTNQRSVNTLEFNDDDEWIEYDGFIFETRSISIE